MSEVGSIQEKSVSEFPHPRSPGCPNSLSRSTTRAHAQVKHLRYIDRVPGTDKSNSVVSYYRIVPPHISGFAFTKQPCVGRKGCLLAPMIQILKQSCEKHISLLWAKICPHAMVVKVSAMLSMTCCW